MTWSNTKLQSCHCEERPARLPRAREADGSDVAIYAIEIASHSFAMTPINQNPPLELGQAFVGAIWGHFFVCECF